MKKMFFFPLAFLSLVATSNAFAGGGYCRQQDNRCTQNLNRADIFKELLSIEGTTSDAQSSLRVIESVAQNLRISIHTSAANYFYVLNFVGGPGYTQLAHSVFQDLTKYVEGRRQLADAVDAFYEIYRIEGVTNDSFVNLNIANGIAHDHRFRLSEAVNFFLDILNLHGGPGYSQLAQSVAMDISNQSRRFDITKVYQVYKEIYRIEGTTNDTLSSLILVLRAGESCGSLEQALDEYLGILSSVGGPGYTQTAQETYRSLFGI